MRLPPLLCAFLVLGCGLVLILPPVQAQQSPSPENTSPGWEQQQAAPYGSDEQRSAQGRDDRRQKTPSRPPWLRKNPDAPGTVKEQRRREKTGPAPNEKQQAGPPQTPPGWEKRESAPERGNPQRSPEVDRQLRENWQRQKERRQNRMQRDDLPEPGPRQEHERNRQQEGQSRPQWLRESTETPGALEKRPQQGRGKGEREGRDNSRNSRGKGPNRGQ
ncbi:MAG: hypothetical protein R6Y91_00775 [Desulfohalobium sp.]